MFSARKPLIGLLLFTSVSLCQAEPPAGGPPENQQPGAQRPPRPGNIMGPRMNPMTLLPDMISELKLDDQQQAEIKRLLDENQQTTQKLFKELSPSPESAAKSREMSQALRNARQANNKDEIVKLTEEMRVFREENAKRTDPIRKQIQDSREQLHTKIAAVMHPDQKEKFETMWQDRMTAQRRNPGTQRRSPQVVRNMVMRLPDLTPDQKKQIDEYFKSYMQAARASQEKPMAQSLTAADEFTEKILSMLTPDQRTKIEAQLGARKPGRAMPGGGELPQQPGGNSQK